MLKQLFLLVFVLLLSACTTIQVPLPGTNILRPRAGLSDVGARINVGTVTTPTVEAIIDPVFDSQGNTINPIPGVKDVDGNETLANSAMVQVELAVDWKERFEFGLSSTRGIYGMWDYALWKNAALTITPSYSSNDSEGGDPDLRTETNEDGEEVTVIDHAFTGKASNFNITQLGSVWLGDVNWAAVYLYGGIGINSYTASITQKSTNVEAKASQVSPSVLAGIHVRLLIFELTTEAGATQIKYRDGTSKMVPTTGASFGLHIAL